MVPATRAQIAAFGQIGYAAKGLAFVVVGDLLCWAAVSHDPNRSGGDDALLELLGRSAGVPTIVAVAVGITLLFDVYTPRPISSHAQRLAHLEPRTLTSTVRRRRYLSATATS